MVKGIDVFQEYFKEYTDQYVLIGGAACSVSFEEQDEGREVMMGISILKSEWIIPFKAKAWLDLREKQDVDSSDTKKHRNDIIRILADMLLEKCTLPDEVRRDMQMFIEQFDVTEKELKNLKIHGAKPEDIRKVLLDTYLD